jgi:hypothetical protein
MRPRASRSNQSADAQARGAGRVLEARAREEHGVVRLVRAPHRTAQPPARHAVAPAPERGHQAPLVDRLHVDAAAGREPGCQRGQQRSGSRHVLEDVPERDEIEIVLERRQRRERVSLRRIELDAGAAQRRVARRDEGEELSRAAAHVEHARRPHAALREAREQVFPLVAIERGVLEVVLRLERRAGAARERVARPGAAARAAVQRVVADVDLARRAFAADGAGVAALRHQERAHRGAGEAGGSAISA